jgi:hypothetical protein
MATVIVRWPPSACVYIYIWRRWGCFWLRENTRKNILRRVAYNPSSSHLLRAQRVWGACLRNRRPQSNTCTGVRAIRFLGEHTRDCSLRSLDQHWSSFSLSVPFKGLHCVHLPASTTYDYIEHTHKMSRVNGATDALSIGPPQGTLCS